MNRQTGDLNAKEISESQISDDPFSTLGTESRVLDLDKLWETLSSLEKNRETVSVTSEEDKQTPRDWTGYITKGRLIGGGGLGDVYIGKWEIPRFLQGSSTSRRCHEGDAALHEGRV